MRKEQLLAAVPPAPVQSLPELYAIAIELAERAAERYGALAARTDENFWPVRCVFEVLTSREQQRLEDLQAKSTNVCGRRPNASDLRWTPIDLVPAEETAVIGNSDLSTPYMAWALAVRHRQRAFIFWTYVIALAVDPQVRTAAEELAKEALWDGNLLRRERRLAWRAESKAAAQDSADRTTDGPVSAALLESLLFRDIVTWSRKLPPAQRAHLLTLDTFHPTEDFLYEIERERSAAEAIEIEPIRRRVLRRAEQLSNIYLDDADNATDQDSMELAQKLAARSIARLAGLRDMAAVDRQTG